MGFCTTKCRRFLLNSWDYDLFAKVKELLRGTRYKTRDELIRAIGRSIRNINKDERADGVRRFPNIWQNMINIRFKIQQIYLSIYKGWIKVMTTVQYFWHGFIHMATAFIYLQYSSPLFITFYQMFGVRRIPSAPHSLLMFLTDRPIASIRSSLVLYRVPRSVCFIFAKR